MFKVRVVVNPSEFQRKGERIEKQLLDFRTYFLQEMAQDVILVSPVDTGTYITSHVISTADVSGATTSHGKPRNQPWEQFAQAGLNQLFADIEGLTDLLTLPKVYLQNIAIHAPYVEFDHGYAVYTMASANGNVYSGRAAARAKGS